MLLCAASCALFIAAILSRFWFGVDPPQTYVSSGSSNGVTVQEAVTFDVQLDPLKAVWNVVRVETINNGPPTSYVEVAYDGALSDICTVQKIQENIGSNCDLVKKVAQAVGYVAIAAAASSGACALVLLLGMLTDYCRNKCCVCLVNLLMMLSFLDALITAALWGALAVWGKGQINDNVPKFVNSIIEQYGAAPVTEKGTFDAKRSLWIEVAGLGPMVIALILNWISCCCGESEKSRKRRMEEIVAPSNNDSGSHPLDNNNNGKRDVEMARFQPSAPSAPPPKPAYDSYGPNSNQPYGSTAPPPYSADHRSAPAGFHATAVKM